MALATALHPPSGGEASLAHLHHSRAGRLLLLAHAGLTVVRGSFLFAVPWVVLQRGLGATLERLTPVADFGRDHRRCLTGVWRPTGFTATDIAQARDAFAEVIPAVPAVGIYFSRLLLLPNNLSAAFTTDPELDELISLLGAALARRGVADDKQYANVSHFFLNLTLARFDRAPSSATVGRLRDVSGTANLGQGHAVEEVSLVCANPVLTEVTTHGRWSLRPPVDDLRLPALQ